MRQNIMQTLIGLNNVHYKLLFRRLDIINIKKHKEESEDLRLKLVLLHSIVKRMIRLYRYEKHKKEQLERAIRAGKYFIEKHKNQYMDLKNSINTILFT